MEEINNYEWVSVSTCAKMFGVSDQTIRNRIREGFYETLNFKRGKLNGILIKVKKWGNQEKSVDATRNKENYHRE